MSTQLPCLKQQRRCVQHRWTRILVTVQCSHSRYESLVINLRLEIKQIKKKGKNRYFKIKSLIRTFYVDLGRRIKFPFIIPGLISALLVLSTLYLFMNVSLSPDIILCGWLGLEHSLTNYLLDSPEAILWRWRDVKTLQLASWLTCWKKKTHTHFEKASSFKAGSRESR